MYITIQQYVTMHVVTIFSTRNVCRVAAGQAVCCKARKKLSGSIWFQGALISCTVDQYVSLQSWFLSNWTRLHDDCRVFSAWRHQMQVAVQGTGKWRHWSSLTHQWRNLQSDTLETVLSEKHGTTLSRKESIYSCGLYQFLLTTKCNPVSGETPSAERSSCTYNQW